MNILFPLIPCGSSFVLANMAGLQRIVSVFRSSSNVDELAVHQRCTRTNSIDSGCVTEGDASQVPSGPTAEENEDFSEGNIDVIQMNGFRREGQATGISSVISEQDIQDRLSNESGVVCLEGPETRGLVVKSSQSPSRNVSFSNVDQKHLYDAGEYDLNKDNERIGVESTDSGGDRLEQEAPSGRGDKVFISTVCDKCTLQIPQDNNIRHNAGHVPCDVSPSHCEYVDVTDCEQRSGACAKCVLESCQCSEHSPSSDINASSQTSQTNGNKQPHSLPSQCRRNRLDPKKLDLNLTSVGPKHNTIPEEPSSSSPTSEHVDNSEMKESVDSVVVKLEPVPQQSSKQSWLLRLFQSKLFDMSIAITYLFNSKEPGVQTYIGM